MHASPFWGPVKILLNRASAFSVAWVKLGHTEATKQAS